MEHMVVIVCLWLGRSLLVLGGEKEWSGVVV